MTEKCFVRNSSHSLVYCKDTGYVTLKSLNNEKDWMSEIKIWIIVSWRIWDLFVPLLLTLIPELWSREKAVSFFSVTEYIVRTARNVKKKLH